MLSWAHTALPTINLRVSRLSRRPTRTAAYSRQARFLDGSRRSCLAVRPTVTGRLRMLRENRRHSTPYATRHPWPGPTCTLPRRNIVSALCAVRVAMPTKGQVSKRTRFGNEVHHRPGQRRERTDRYCALLVADVLLPACCVGPGGLDSGRRFLLDGRLPQVRQEHPAR